MVWEKAGQLDSTDLSPSLAPVVQFGADVRITPRVVVNVDMKWNPWRTDLEADGVAEAVARRPGAGRAVGARPRADPVDQKRSRIVARTGIDQREPTSLIGSSPVPARPSMSFRPVW